MRTYNPYVLRPELLALIQKLFPGTPDDVTYDEVHDLTQQLILNRRTPSGPIVQRWNAAPWGGYDRFDADQLIEDFAALGFVDEVTRVRQAHFDYVVIPGGTPEPQRRRLALAAKLWRSGLSFDHLLFMGGRPYDAKMDNHAKLTSDITGVLPMDGDWVPPTLNELKRGGETRVNRDVWAQAVLPTGMSRLRPGFVTGTPKPGKPTVTAADQVDAWMSGLQPKSGSVLVVTVQPHLTFQGETWNDLLAPRGFTVEAVAASARHGRHDPAYLGDGFARALHVAWKKTQK